MKTWDDIRFSCKSYTCIYKSIVFRQAQPVSMQNYCKEIRSNYILPHCCSIRSNRTMFDSKINKTGMMTTAKGKALYHITHIPFITIKTVTYLFSSLPAVKISLSFNKIKEHSKLVSIWSLLWLSLVLWWASSKLFCCIVNSIHMPVLWQLQSIKLMLLLCRYAKCLPITMSIYWKTL